MLFIYCKYRRDRFMPKHPGCARLSTAVQEQRTRAGVPRYPWPILLGSPPALPVRLVNGLVIPRSDTGSFTPKPFVHSLGDYGDTARRTQSCGYFRCGISRLPARSTHADSVAYSFRPIEQDLVREEANSGQPGQVRLRHSYDDVQHAGRLFFENQNMCAIIPSIMARISIPCRQSAHTNLP